MSRIAIASPRVQRGFTLVEILVTLVLVSVGLLGVAALQLTTLRGNQESYVRSQASVLAADILDRIRANPLAFRDGAYDVTWDGTGTTSTRAGDDLRAWQQAIDSLLPGGANGNTAGRIVRASAGGRHIVTVSIRWTERPAGNGTNVEQNGVREFSTRSEI